MFKLIFMIFFVFKMRTGDTAVTAPFYTLPIIAVFSFPMLM